MKINRLSQYFRVQRLVPFNGIDPWALIKPKFPPNAAGKVLLRKGACYHGTKPLKKEDGKSFHPTDKEVVMESDCILLQDTGAIHRSLKIRFQGYIGTYT